MGNSDDPAASPSKQLFGLARPDGRPTPEPSGSRAPAAGKKQEQAAEERTGVPDCVYHVKFGRCKFGMNCEFNHPPKQCEFPAPAAGKKQCNEVLDCFYCMKMGSCKFGINSKFNHPPRKPVLKRSGGGENSGIGDEASTSEYNVVPRSNVPVAVETSPATIKNKETHKVVSSSPSSKTSGKRTRIEGYGLLVCESGATFLQSGTKRKILSCPKDRSTARASAKAVGR